MNQHLWTLVRVDNQNPLTPERICEHFSNDSETGQLMPGSHHLIFDIQLGSKEIPDLIEVVIPVVKCWEDMECGLVVLITKDHRIIEALSEYKDEYQFLICKSMHEATLKLKRFSVEN
jgi:hypothetical protein